MKTAITTVGAIWLMLAAVAHGFSSALFQETPTKQITTPSKNNPAVDIELPDFGELFDRIQQVSPLARTVIAGGTSPRRLGFAAVDDTCT
jgi:hypothetical protein